LGKLSDHYKITKNIGNGTFGQVLKVIHKDSNSIRAVKRIQTTSSLDLPKMMSEVDLLKKIDHPNIIRIFEVIQEARTVNIVMELCTGGELFDRIQSCRKFSESQAATLMSDVFSAIKYCHDNNIVHRDLKPENILFESNKDDARLKLIDFGASKYFKPHEKMKGFTGSAYYVAPEVIEGNYDEKCDVWSLGVILFIMLSGNPPFRGVDDQETLKMIREQQVFMEEDVWERISDDAKKLIQRMLQKDPKFRPDINEVINDKWLNNRNSKKSSKRFVSKTSLMNLKEFSRESYLKKATFHYITSQFISSEEIDELRSIFEKLDENQDGKLSKEELLKGYSEFSDTFSIEVEKILENCDIDGNGYLEYSEFLTATINRQMTLSRERLKAAFKSYDQDGNGKITLNEFSSTFRGTGIEEDLIKELIQEADKNNDGEIDFEEFEAYIKRPSNRC
jgi:calcium-dependent protein kinase